LYPLCSEFQPIVRLCFYPSVPVPPTPNVLPPTHPKSKPLCECGSPTATLTRSPSPLACAPLDLFQLPHLLLNSFCNLHDICFNPIIIIACVPTPCTANPHPCNEHRRSLSGDGIQSLMATTENVRFHTFFLVAQLHPLFPFGNWPSQIR